MTAVEPQMAEGIKDHALVQIIDSEKFKSFYMKRLGKGRIMSTLITFTPEGIVIQGDLTPGRNGNVSCLGYGLGWFRSRLSEDYLCEKFLELGWFPELAARDLRRIIKEIKAGELLQYDDYAVKEMGQLANVCDDGDIGMESFRDDWHTIDDDYESTPGWGYNPREKGWLCAIQQRFAELYDVKEAADLKWANNGLGYAISC